MKKMVLKVAILATVFANSSMLRVSDDASCALSSNIESALEVVCVMASQNK